jgi:hypothetical protein
MESPRMVKRESAVESGITVEISQFLLIDTGKAKQGRAPLLIAAIGN